MNNLFNGIFGGHQPIDRTYITNGLTVSTVNTCDCGPETAIIDSNGAHPVERYATLEAATQGHKNWVSRACEMKTGDKIVKLCYDDSFEITIKADA